MVAAEHLLVITQTKFMIRVKYSIVTSTRLDVKLMVENKNRTTEINFRLASGLDCPSPKTSDFGAYDFMLSLACTAPPERLILVTFKALKFKWP